MASRLSAYNWSNLSAHDFEAVCRDLLSATLGVQVEAFAAGPDGGVDLRATIGKQLVVAQAKHYIGSSYSSLLASVRKEKAKLAGIRPKPARYILYTSVPLTPSRKREIKAELHPYMKRLSDIHGLEEIEGLLVRNTSIVEHHYKLWLASASVLDRIIGSATLSRSRIRTEQILDRSRLYVPHEKMFEATEILWKEHCLIVSGPPGIGKTTLAEMLTLKFLSVGYTSYFLSDVNDLEERLKSDSKDVYVYDDFLGRTNLSEAPSASDQERLFSAMRYIANRPNKYFILTTREYLYREASAASERIADSRANVMKCVLDVAGYSPLNRAEILYNHLFWASNVTHADLKDFVKEGWHWKIIRHPNFNPRWIADTLHRLGEPPTSSRSPEWN